ncbi:hypothetical protein ET445_03110 [Agromyces protaetiae]|uniref:Alpha/beta hydrolase n=1 Tax=Agromyces protaetiae TaxID=2509455 RepID=A0A4P6FDN8_9MICO|nr:hypothetical protein [Agromyces protaetiae]QAY72479.1 hypothetical protein ET445_03110 [Agromyces protaetiae]
MGRRGLARKLRWLVVDYAYASWRQLAVFGAALTGARTPRAWGSGDDSRPSLPEVVLVPGVYEHWAFLRPLGDRLNRAGHRVRVVHGLGVNRRPVDETAAKLARALARTRAPAAGRVIVAHSKGGLIGKRALIDASDASGLALLGVVAICTPFGGSPRARLLADPSIRAFLPDDPTIAALRAATGVDRRIVSVFGTFDPHIPGGSALEGAAANLEVPVAGHFRPLGSPATADAVLAGIARLEASAPVG